MTRGKGLRLGSCVSISGPILSNRWGNSPGIEDLGEGTPVLMTHGALEETATRNEMLQSLKHLRKLGMYLEPAALKIQFQMPQTGL